jgi:hypothetical protein
MIDFQRHSIGFRSSDKEVATNMVNASSNGDKSLYLNEVSGLVYLLDGAKSLGKKPLSFAVKLVETGSNSVLSQTSVQVDLVNLPTQYNQSVFLNADQVVDDEWLNLISFGFLAHVHKDFAIQVTCANLDRFTCSNMFRFNPLSSHVLYNEHYALNALFARNHNLLDEQSVHVFIAFQLSPRRLEFELNVNFHLITSGNKWLFDASRPSVHLLDAHNSRIPLCLTRSDLSSQLQVVRVRNLATNTQVLTLDYVLNASLQSLQLSNVHSLEANQL